jgi:urease accessory protein
MTIDLLQAIQHADSAFPSGGFAFSQGLESLASAPERPRGAEIARFIRAQLALRWKTADRVALVHAHRAAADLQAVAVVDHDVEASTIVELLRAGSRRNGLALLTAHVRLGTPRAAEYQAMVHGGAALGHLAVVQGMLWQGIGIAERTAVAMSGYGLVNSMATAAIRLGLVGTIEAQRWVTSLLPVIAEAVEAVVADDEPMCSYAPFAEIAVMRHERQPTRLFFN